MWTFPQRVFKMPIKLFKLFFEDSKFQLALSTLSTQLALSTGWPVCHDMKQGAVNQVF